MYLNACICSIVQHCVYIKYNLFYCYFYDYFIAPVRRLPQVWHEFNQEKQSYLFYLHVLTLADAWMIHTGWEKPWGHVLLLSVLFWLKLLTGMHFYCRCKFSRIRLKFMVLFQTWLSSLKCFHKKKENICMNTRWCKRFVTLLSVGSVFMICLQQTPHMSD